jgi:mRNA-degrading endonuclease RelE of RelBE toxin-antitoxin system
MAYTFAPTQRFAKNYLSLSKKEQKQVDEKLLLLADNPLHPSLRAKKVKGAEKLFESSINMDIRIIWYYEGSNIIILLDVGHHDILKQY